MPATSPRNSEGNLVVTETLINAQTVTTTTSSLYVGSGWSGVKAVKLQATLASVTGTTPSYTIKLQDSADGTNWVDVSSGAFGAITTSSTASLTINPVILNDNVRAVITVTGTTPSAVVTLTSVSIAHSNI